jgi:hypothetical protein
MAMDRAARVKNGNGFELCTLITQDRNGLPGMLNTLSIAFGGVFSILCLCNLWVYPDGTINSSDRGRPCAHSDR